MDVTCLNFKVIFLVSGVIYVFKHGVSEIVPETKRIIQEMNEWKQFSKISMNWIFWQKLLFSCEIKQKISQQEKTLRNQKTFFLIIWIGFVENLFSANFLFALLFHTSRVCLSMWNNKLSAWGKSQQKKKCVTRKNHRVIKIFFFLCQNLFNDLPTFGRFIYHNFLSY